MKEIITALNKAYRECGYVQKEAAPGLKYKFAGEAAFIEALRPVLIENGIVVFQSGVEVVNTEGYKTSNGNSMNRIIAKFEFTFAHTSGEFIKVTALGEGADSGDKTAPKCNTGALKYALRQTLLIETGDDPDATPSSDQQRAKEDPLLAKAQNKVNDVLAVVKNMDTFDLAQWVIDSPKEVDALRWVQRNYPQLLKPLTELRLEL